MKVKKNAKNAKATEAKAARAAKLPEKAATTAKVETAAPVASKPSKFKGATTGLRVMQYQDQTFAANATAMLTDEELAAAWRAEFPGAVAFMPFHVKGARRDYNAGTHSKDAPKPATPLHEVIVVAGKRQFADGVTARTPKTEVKAEPVAAKPVAEPVVAKKKGGARLKKAA